MMSYSIFGLCFFVLFVKLSSMAEGYFMENFENNMKQFEQNMQNLGAQMQQQMNQNLNGHNPKFGNRFPFGGNNNNWIKQFANPQIPVFPPNFPWPPNCRMIPDVPGLQYPDPEEGNNVVISSYPPRPVRKTYTYQTYECTDPRYAQPFYLLVSQVKYSSGEGANQSQSSTGKTKYYSKDGNEMFYQAEVKTKPLWE